MPRAGWRCSWRRSSAASASAVFLFTRKPWGDRLAVAGAELTVVIGLLVLVTGPLWARKAWGVWWQWDARLTSTLVMWLIFNAYLLLRRYGGPGSDRLAAAVALFGMANVPFVYWSVNVWRTLHPKTSVIPSLQPGMRGPFWFCVVAFLLVSTLILAVRTELEKRRQELDELYLAMEECMKRIGALVVTLLLAGGRRRSRSSPRRKPRRPRRTASSRSTRRSVPQDAMPAPRLVAIAYGFIWVVLFGYLWSVRARLATVEREMESMSRRVASGQKVAMNFGQMSSAHFMLIPAVLLIGMVVGWILGSRAAADAYAADVKRREERAAAKRHEPTADHEGTKTQRHEDELVLCLRAFVTLVMSRRRVLLRPSAPAPVGSRDSPAARRR